jgi:hypothetical protein
MNNKILLELPSKLVQGRILHLKMSIGMLWLNNIELRDKSLKSPHDRLCLKFVSNANFINVMHCSY